MEDIHQTTDTTMSIRLEDLKKHTKANSRKSVPRGQDFRLKFNPKTFKFKFSRELYESLELEGMGLNSYTHPETGEVFITVQETDKSVFYKHREGRQRAYEFKNEELAKSLTDLGITSEKLDLKYIKTFADSRLYKVIVDPSKTAGENRLNLEENKSTLNSFMSSEKRF